MGRELKLHRKLAQLASDLSGGLDLLGGARSLSRARRQHVALSAWHVEPVAASSVRVCDIGLALHLAERGSEHERSPAVEFLDRQAHCLRNSRPGCPVQDEAVC